MQSLTWGVELDEDPGESDTTPFPRENVVMMVYGGCPPPGAHCGATTYYGWRHRGSVV
jgi:hypothetical protein